MGRLFRVLFRTSSVLNGIGAATLTFMMLMTVFDILMRAAGHPILGTYEVVSILLAVVIGFSIPKVSLDHGHVQMEFVTDALTGRARAMLITFTRLLCIALFLLIGYNLFSVANELRLSGEVSPTIQLPFYPVAYGVGVCCFIECFVFAFDLKNIWKRRDE